jgi:hypothetical protein
MKRRVVFHLLLILLTLPLCFPASSHADSNVYLETVGGFGGSYIYMTYAYIGVTADAYSEDIYQAEQVQIMMDETVGMLNNLIGMLQKVRDTDIVDNDKRFIDDMIEVLGLLKREAQALSTYAASKDPEDIKKYDEARKEVWPRIKQLLGIK